MDKNELFFCGQFFTSETNFTYHDIEYVRKQNNTRINWFTVNEETGEETLVTNNDDFEKMYLENWRYIDTK